MVVAGDILSYAEMCITEGLSLQQGMNYRPRGRASIFLMSTRSNAPYDDRVEDEGNIIIYEGHDEKKSRGVADPKLLDQPLISSTGSLTQNGRFYEAALGYRNRERPAEIIHVYEKILPGIWVFNGSFELIDSWVARSGERNVVRFRLQRTDTLHPELLADGLRHDRTIPSSVKLEVWKRDQGKCVQCGSTDNLHFDHIIPFSRGGSSLVASNIQILCARHNLAKHDQIA